MANVKSEPEDARKAVVFRQGLTGRRRPDIVTGKDLNAAAFDIRV